MKLLKKNIFTVTSHNDKLPHLPYAQNYSLLLLFAFDSCYVCSPSIDVRLTEKSSSATPWTSTFSPHLNLYLFVYVFCNSYFCLLYNYTTYKQYELYRTLVFKKSLL